MIFLSLRTSINSQESPKIQTTHNLYNLALVVDFKSNLNFVGRAENCRWFNPIDILRSVIQIGQVKNVFFQMLNGLTVYELKIYLQKI